MPRKRYYDVQLGWLIEYNVLKMPAYGAVKPDAYPLAAEYARTTVNLSVWGGERVARIVTESLLDE